MVTLELHPGKNAKCERTPPPTNEPPGATPPVQETSKAELFEEWPNGFKMNLSILMKQKVEGGWKMTLWFPVAVDSLQTPNAKQKSRSKDRKKYFLENKQYNAFLAKCSRLEMIIIGQKAENSKAPRQADIEFRRIEYWFREDKDECVDCPVQKISTKAVTFKRLSFLSCARVLLYSLAMSLLSRSSLVYLHCI